MPYRLTVVEFEPSKDSPVLPHYEIRQERTVRQLEVVLTDEEFQAIKKAVLEVM